MSSDVRFSVQIPPKPAGDLQNFRARAREPPPRAARTTATPPKCHKTAAFGCRWPQNRAGAKNPGNIFAGAGLPTYLPCVPCTFFCMPLGSRYKKKCPALVLPAPSGPRAKKKGADHRPSARRWPEHVRRGTRGASNCTNGLNYGPATAKSAQMDLARGFARWLLRDDPDTDHEPISGRLSTPMVGLRGEHSRHMLNFAKRKHLSCAKRVFFLLGLRGPP